MKTKYVIGGFIIVAFVVWGVVSFMSKTIRYVSLNEVANTAGTMQVMGRIDFDSVRYDTDHSRMTFDISGLEEHTLNNRLTVVYGGVVPGNFEQATSVVVKGKYENNIFMADQLYVKCPSKYQGMEKEILKKKDEA